MLCNMSMLLTGMLVLFPLSSAFEPCFHDVLLQTQNCSNTRVVYYAMERTFSGFGSEFFAYFIHALKDAVLENARLKYVITGEQWENDCPGT